MIPNANTILQQAVAALKAGNKAEARTLLTQAIKQNSLNAQAWLYLSAVVDTPAQRRECLERVLYLEPRNATAQHALTQLSETTKVQPETRATGTLPPALTAPAQTRHLLYLGAIFLFAIVLSVAVLAAVINKARQPKVNPLYAGPYIIVYGRTTCGLTRSMEKKLEKANLPYLFKPIDDDAVAEEIYPRMSAAGLNTWSFYLPVVDVNGHILLEATVEEIAAYYYAQPE